MQTVFNLLVVAEGVARHHFREQCRALYSYYGPLSMKIFKGKAVPEKRRIQGETNE